MLLFIIPILSFTMAVLHLIIPWFVNLLVSKTPMEIDLHAELYDLNTKKKGLSLKSDYVQYIQIERQENQKRNILEQLQKKRETSKYAYNLIVKYAVKILLGIVIFLISIWNRYQPIVIFEKNFNFFPFDKILSFPTGIDNSVSVFIWIALCGTISNKVASYF